MTDERLAELVQAAEHSGCGYIGIRGDDRIYNVGNYLPNSHMLMQDEPLDDDLAAQTWNEELGAWDFGELDGTCAVDAGTGTADDIRDSIDWATHHYAYSHHYVIGGDSIGYGEDEHEIIIRDAVVIAVID